MQSNRPGNLTCSRSPVPRKKITVGLTVIQAEMLSALWQEHSAALHAMLRAWCGDAHNASDMLQEVFRRLAESPATMTRMKNARAFLAVSARRIAIDFARRSNTRSAYQTAAGAEVPTAENPGPTDENLRAVITEALDELPAEQRSVFEHKILNGRTLEEISRLEGVPLNTVSSRLRYALDKIRGQLRPYYDDLNRRNFKIMKNDPFNANQVLPRRIITPLEPKRVPSVAPGLEGLAAMAPDACEAAPEIAVHDAEFVELLPGVELQEPQVASCGVGGNAWEFEIPMAGSLDHEADASVADHTDVAASHDGDPEPVTYEMLPADPTADAAPEHVDPTLDVTWETTDLSPEDLMTAVFEGYSDHGTGGVDPDPSDGWSSLQTGGPDPIPFDFNSGFEVCVLPMPDFTHESFDPHSLFADYQSFLSDNQDWISHIQGGDIQAQVITPSGHFSDLEFGTPGEAAAFDRWFETHHNAEAHLSGSTDGGDASDSSPALDVSDHHDFSNDPASHDLNTEGDGVMVTRDLSNTDVIQPFWRSGGTGGDHVVAYSMAGSSGSIALPSSTLTDSNVGEAHTETVLSAGITVASPAENHSVDLPHDAVPQHSSDANHSPELTAAFLQQAHSSHFHDSVAANETDHSALPTEIAIGTQEVSVMASAAPGAHGLGPSADQMMIVEFGVLSPSEAPTGHGVHVTHAESHGGVEPPVVVAAGGSHEGAVATSHDEPAHAVLSQDDAIPHIADQHDAVADALVAHKVDAPTAAAGAVAAGTVGHAAGVAPASRRPLPKL